MKKWLLSFVLISFFVGVVSADEASVADGLSKVIPSVTKDQVSKTPIDGLYQVIVGARVVYVSDDGRYIIQGEMVDLVNRENMTEEALKLARKSELAKVDEKKMIIFPAKEQKHTITIFSDIDCGYCRKLHAKIDSYTDAGMTVRYLFFPRSGRNTESYFKAISVWCAKDRKQALTDAKLNNKVVNKTCDNPIDAHMKIAQAFGVTGTPAIIADDGTMVPGFVPAKALAEHLGW
ncbi:MAG TPA: DsbC family protein [Cycloclasticus sp.]|jgi:thiol:disulfide interchange protein DsbC|nr:DsbC family protein [Cycloclasticus sp.]